MAVELRPDDPNLKNQLISTLTAEAFEAGRYTYAAAAFSVDTEYSPGKVSLLEQRCEMLNALNTNIFAQLDAAKKFHGGIQALKGIVESNFLEEAESMVGSLMGAHQKACEFFDRAFDALDDKINGKLEAMIAKLNAFREAPTKEKSDELIASLKKLEKRVGLISSLSQKCSIQFTHTQNIMITEINEMALRLFSLIDPEATSSAPLWNRLEVLIRDKNAVAQSEQTQVIDGFKEVVSGLLTEESQNTLDGKIYALAPEPKGGDGWGKTNRYVDMARFKAAFTEIAIMQIENELQKLETGPQLTNDELVAFYTTLHELAFGPETEDKVAWARHELPKLVHLFVEALNVIRPQPIETNSDSDIEIVELEEEGMPSSDILLTLASEHPEIDMLEEILLQMKEEARANSKEVDKQAVKTAITQNLPASLCNSLYGIVYQIADNKWIEDDWGKKHCADDLPRLFKALNELRGPSVTQSGI